MQEWLTRCAVGLLPLTASCADLPASTQDGGGGAGGTATCVTIAAASSDRDEEHEVNPSSTRSSAIGTVSSGTDPLDVWVTTTCGGDYRIALFWGQPEQHDLDLVPLDVDDLGLVHRSRLSTGGANACEEFSGEIPAGREVTLEVQARSTTGELPPMYNLVVAPPEETILGCD